MQAWNAARTIMSTCRIKLVGLEFKNILVHTMISVPCDLISLFQSIYRILQGYIDELHGASYEIGSRRCKTGTSGPLEAQLGTEQGCVSISFEDY